MVTFRSLLLVLAVLCIGLAVVLPARPAVGQALGIVGVVLAGVDLVLRLAT